MEKEVDGRKIKYYYDGSLLLCEKDGAGKMQKVYVNDGEGIVGMIRYIYKNTGEFSHYQRLYYLYDSLGSVSVITGENGLPLQNYTYSPYGSKMNIDYDPVNNLRFVGRYGGYKDDDTGLTYFWHRWYDERDGRWVSRDIMRITQLSFYCRENVYLLGIENENFYIYSENNSKNLIDPLGLFGVRCNISGLTLCLSRVALGPERPFLTIPLFCEMCYMVPMPQVKIPACIICTGLIIYKTFGVEQCFERNCDICP